MKPETCHRKLAVLDHSTGFTVRNTEFRKVGNQCRDREGGCKVRLEGKALFHSASAKEGNPAI
jgi:hypothetical protein